MAAKLNCTTAFLMLAVASGPPASAQEATTSAAEKFLQKAGIGTDDASLIAFLRKHSAGDVDAEQIDRLIRKFGSGDFTEREQAYRKVVGVGLRAVDRLRRAEQDTDSEIRQRAKQAIVAIERNGPPPEAPAMVVRLLVKRQSPGAVEALVHFLPFAPDEETAEPIWFGLEALIRQQRKVDASIVEALTDRLPTRRALAGCLLASFGTAEQRAAVRRLLQDDDLTVRLRAAQGLLAGKDTAGIPVLIALLEGSPVELAWQAEELLRWVAGEESPEALIGTGSASARKQCCAAWQNWWQQHGTGVDAARVMQTVRRPGLFMVRATAENPGDAATPPTFVTRFYTCGWDGKPRSLWWKPITDPWIKGYGSLFLDYQYRSGNRLLLAEKRPTEDNYVTPVHVRERDSDGRILWEFQTTGLVPRCRRLPGGKTLVYKVPGESRLLFVATNGKEVEAWDSDKHGHYFVQPERNPLLYNRWWRYAAELRNGNLLYIDGSRLMERDIVNDFRGEVIVRKSLFGISNNSVGFTQSFSARPMLELVRVGFAQGGVLDPAAWMAHRIAGLKNKDPEVRELSADEVAEFGPKAIGAVPDLIEVLDDPEPRVGSSASSAFVHLGPQAIPDLLKASKDTRPEVRGGALSALSHFKNETKSIAPVIIDALQQDKDPAVRRRAAYVLANIDATVEGVLPALIKALKDREEPPDKLGSVARAAASSFQTIGRKAKPVLPALIDALKDDDDLIIGSIIACLRQIGPDAEPAVPALVEVLLNQRIRAGIRSGVPEALSKIGRAAKPAIPALRHALNDPDEEVRRRVKIALEVIDP